MIIKYVNSTGQEVNLNEMPYKMLVSDILDYEWEVVTSANKIIGFGYDVKEKNLNIDVHRSKARGARENANTLTEIFETDILAEVPGRLYIDDQYLRCYIKSSEMGNWETDQIMQCEYGIITDFPFWITEKKYEFKINTGKEIREHLDFPFDMPFDLMGDEKGIGNIISEHYAPCDFLLTVYGPCVNPRIVIGNNLYEVKTKLDTGEYMLIDSRAGTIVRVRTNGMKVNEFDNRVTDPNSPFEKIQLGYNLVSWDGSFGFDLLLYIERSVPAWQGK